MEKESIVKRLIRATRSCAMATLAFSLSVHEALAQPAGGGSGVHERVDAGSKALGGILGVAFVALMVRSLLKKKK